MNKYKKPEDLIFFLKEEYGLSVFSDTQKCLDIVSNMFESDKLFIFLLKTAINNNVFVEIIKARYSSSENKLIYINRAIKILTDECGIDKEKAIKVVGWLASIIYSDEWNSFLQKKKASPIYINNQDKKSEKLLLKDINELEKNHKYDELFKLIKPLADKGIAEYQSKLGDLYYDGNGIKQNYKLAVRYYRLASNQKNAEGQRNLGLCYYNGSGVRCDYKKAFKYFKIAAKKGKTDALVDVGWCYYEGKGIAQNYKKAFKCFKMAKKKGITYALKGIASCYFEGKGVSLNLKKAFKYYKLAANQGDADAQNIVGLIYKFGLGVSNNRKKAKRYFSLALKQGNYEFKDTFDNFSSPYSNNDFKHIKLTANKSGNTALIVIAVFYLFGMGVNNNSKKAFRYFKLAANQGDADAQNYVGCMYKLGIGVSRNNDESKRYFSLATKQNNTKTLDNVGVFFKTITEMIPSYYSNYIEITAKNGDAKAQNTLGNWYYIGHKVIQDYVEAAKYYKLAADQGEANAQNSLGNCYYNGKGVEQNYVEAFKYYALAAYQGYPSSLNNIGWCYYNGYGVNQNFTEAIRYYLLAAEKGDNCAQNNLGHCYYNGEGVEQNYAEAAKYFKLAADQGEVNAQNSLGNCYYNGEGVEQNYVEAFKYYKLAADQGEINAQNSLGDCYYYGKGVEQNHAEAVKYYKLAADQGEVNAQNSLGNCYYNGEGVEQNYVEAFKYYKLAANQGNLEAQMTLDKYKTPDYFNDNSNNEKYNIIENKNWILEDINLEMIYCPAGNFMMGSPESEFGRNSDEIQHQVIISKPFMIGKYPVTQQQYKTIMRYHSPLSRREDKPKGSENKPEERVNYDEAKEFCNRLNTLYKAILPNGYVFDLPTEAQWEYACRAGTTTALSNGNNLSNNNSFDSYIDEIAWYCLNSGSETHSVGQKKPNTWGIYDMLGNVWEWCRDSYCSYPSTIVIDPFNKDGYSKVCRGGSWINNETNCRSAFRLCCSSSRRSKDLGFRVALVPIN